MTSDKQTNKQDDKLNLVLGNEMQSGVWQSSPALTFLYANLVDGYNVAVSLLLFKYILSWNAGTRAKWAKVRGENGESERDHASIKKQSWPNDAYYAVGITLLLTHSSTSKNKSHNKL